MVKRKHYETPHYAAFSRLNYILLKLSVRQLSLETRLRTEWLLFNYLLGWKRDIFSYSSRPDPPCDRISLPSNENWGLFSRG